MARSDERDSSTEPVAEPTIERFLGEPTRDLVDWRWLWHGDHAFPLHSHRGVAGRVIVLLKRLLRPLVRLPVADLWDRQRTFNLILVEALESAARERRALADLTEVLKRHVQELDGHLRDVQQDLESVLERLRRDLKEAVEAHASRLEELDLRTTEGMTDVLRHNDALFSRVDQKLDRYRQEARELWSRLGSVIASVSSSESTAGATQSEQAYVELERRFRGSEAEIRERVATYMPYLRDHGPVLDLGCGRGEALEMLLEEGVEARGVDSSAEMVARCHSKKLEVAHEDLLDFLASAEEGAFGSIVSFHVIEHLPAEAIERLARLAWRSLRPGGLIVLETPSPLSLVMSARNFWIDPTHLRPVHPASLELILREAGFEPVHRLDLHPFAPQERLPEIDVGALAPSTRALGDEINRLRDAIDDLLFGDQDFAMIGHRPG